MPSSASTRWLFDTQINVMILTSRIISRIIANTAHPAQITQVATLEIELVVISLWPETGVF
jgi:hypothetical protein